MNKLYFFLLSFLFMNLLRSQNTFNKHYHFGWPLAIANSIYVTDSCYYFSGLIVDTIPPYRSGLIFGQLDLEGDVVFTNSIFDNGKTFENWLTPLIYSNDDHFISMGFGVDSLGRYKYWMKLTKQGLPVQTHCYRNYYFPLEEATGVNDFFQHPETLDYYTLNNAFIRENDLGLTPGYNSVLTKLNSEGDSVFSIAYEYQYQLLPKNILFNNDEILMGFTYNNTNITHWNLKYYTKIIAVDTLGQIQWSWQSPSSLQQGANDMLLTENGGLIVVSGRGFLEQVNVETKRILWDKGLVFKLDSNQQIVWETEFKVPYPGINELSYIVEAIDGSGYIAAGKQTDLYGDEPGGALMGWIAKTSSQGDSLWSRKLFYYEYPDSLEYWHRIHDLQTTPDGGYLMSGQTLDVNQLSNPIQQAWFIKVDSEGCLIPDCGLLDAIEPNDQEGPPLLLYPNPTDDYLNVYLGNSGGKKWSFLLYNSIGQEVGRYVATMTNTTYMITINHLIKGQYYLGIVDETGRLLKSYPWIKQ